MTFLSFIHRTPDRNPKRYSFRRMLVRGLTRRCPQCGAAPMFAGYLALVDVCHNCREPLGHIRTDDAAPWVTIMLAGHILVSLLVYLEFSWSLSVLEMTLVMSFATIVSVLAILPLVKGVLVAVMWRLGLDGAETRT